MHTILMATDGSPSSVHALDFAIDLAHGLQAKLEILSVCPRSVGRVGVGMHVFEMEEVSRARKIAYAAVAKASVAGVDATAHAMHGDVVSCVCDAALALRAELLVTGSRGRGSVSGAILGSVSNALVRRSPVPVTVVRGAPFHPGVADARSYSISECV